MAAAGVYETDLAWVTPRVADVLVGSVLWRTSHGGVTWRIITSQWPS